MATWARGQGAIQSNEIALGRERREKNNDEGMAGGRDRGRRRGRKYYIILCVPPKDHGNSLIRATSVPAVQ